VGLELDELTGEQEGGEGPLCARPAGMLGNGDDGATILPIDARLFDLAVADGVERRTARREEACGSTARAAGDAQELAVGRQEESS